MYLARTKGSYTHETTLERTLFVNSLLSSFNLAMLYFALCWLPVAPLWPIDPSLAWIKDIYLPPSFHVVSHAFVCFGFFDVGPLLLFLYLFVAVVHNA